MGRTRGNCLDRSRSRRGRHIAVSRTGPGAWTTICFMGARRCRSPVSYTGWLGGVLIYAGGADGHCLRVVDDRRFDGHAETRGEHVG